MKHKCGSLIFASFLLLFPSILLVANANEFKNLSFEFETYAKQPRSWNIEGYAEDYSALLTKDVSKRGTKSLHVKLVKGELYALLTIDSKVLSGNKLTFTGSVLSSSNDALNVELITFIPNSGKPHSSGPTDLPLGAWTDLSLSHTFGRLPESQVILALKANGTGEFWADDFAITIGGQVFGNAKPDFRPPTQREVDALNKIVAEITPDDTPYLQQQLRALNFIVDGSKIIALGENSHGSSSIFKLKLALIQYLVENAGVRLFALESPTVEADAINDYVNGGKATKKELLASLAYSSWRIQEMLDIVEWIKIYNSTTQKKVQFRGFDMQNSYAAMKFLLVYTQRLHEPVNEKLKELQTILEFEKLNETNLTLAMALSSSIKMYFRATSKTIADKKAYRYSVVLNQSIHLRSSDPDVSRDRFMAQNIHSLQQECDCRVIVSADNDHVRKQDGRAGYFLSELYGKEYKAIGFTYNTGTYAALGDEVSYKVHPSYTGTYEYLFSKAMARNFILDLNKANEIALLEKKQGFRYIGSTPQDSTQFFEMNLKGNFDAVIYVEKSTHTQRIE